MAYLGGRGLAQELIDTHDLSARQPMLALRLLLLLLATTALAALVAAALVGHACIRSARRRRKQRGALQARAVARRARARALAGRRGGGCSRARERTVAIAHADFECVADGVSV
jgi:hypothetical protein